MRARQALFACLADSQGHVLLAMAYASRDALHIWTPLLSPIVHALSCVSHAHASPPPAGSISPSVPRTQAPCLTRGVRGAHPRRHTLRERWPARPCGRRAARPVKNGRIAGLARFGRREACAGEPSCSSGKRQQGAANIRIEQESACRCERVCAPLLAPVCAVTATPNLGPTDDCLRGRMAYRSTVKL